MIDVQFIPFDSFSKIIGNRTYYFLAAKTIDRQKVIMRVDYNTHFFIAVQDAARFEALGDLSNDFSDILSIEKSNLILRENFQTYKINLSRLFKYEQKAKQIFDFVKNNCGEAALHTVDLKQKYKLFQDYKLKSFKLYSGKAQKLDLTINDLRCEYILDLISFEEEGNLTNDELDYAVNTLFLDFTFRKPQYYGVDNPLLMITARIRDFTKVFQWKYPGLKETTYVESESEMFEKFSQFLSKIKPDVIIVNDMDDKLRLFNARSSRYGAKYSFYLDMDESNFKLANKRGLVLIDQKSLHNKLNLYKLSYKNLYYKFFREKFSPISKEYIVNSLLTKGDSNIFLMLENYMDCHHRFYTEFYLNVLKDILAELNLPLDFLSHGYLSDVFRNYLEYKYRDSGQLIKINGGKIANDLLIDINEESSCFTNILELNLNFVYAKLIADNNIGLTDTGSLTLNKKLLDNLRADIDRIHDDDFSSFLFGNSLSGFYGVDNKVSHNSPIYFKYLTKLFLFNNLGKFIFSLSEKDKFDIALTDFVRAYLSKFEDFELISVKGDNIYLKYKRDLDDNYMSVNEMLLDVNVALSDMNLNDLSNYNLFLSTYIFDNGKMFSLDYDLLPFGNTKKNLKILEVINRSIAFILLEYDYYKGLSSKHNNPEFYKEHNIQIERKDVIASIESYRDSLLKQLNDHTIDPSLLMSGRKVNKMSKEFENDFKYNNLEKYHDGQKVNYIVCLENTEDGPVSKKLIVDDPSEFKKKINTNFNVNSHYYYVIINRYFESILKLIK